MLKNFKLQRFSNIFVFEIPSVFAFLLAHKDFLRDLRLT